MTIQEYNDIYKNPIVKSMEITSSGGVTITNTNICMEQMSLEESLCSENSLVFGACESGCFKIRIADMNHNFEGEWLTVMQKIAIDDEGCLLKEDGSYLLTEDGDRISLGAHDNAIPYGRFKVFSDKPTNDRRWRDLTCYDAMYDILNAEVIDWYNGLTFPMTMKNFRDSFFTYVGVTQATVTLVNDSFMIQGGFSNEGSLSGKTIITSICELNGVFGHISRQGQFEYISLPSTDSLTLDWYMDGTGAYEDYTVQKITGITAKSSEEDVGTTVGTDTNVYIVQDNPLIYGSEGTQGLTTALTNLLNNVKDITYRPFNVNTYGNPMLPLGTNLTISTRNQTINSFLMTRVLSGIQSLVDCVSANGEKYVPSQVNSLRTETKRTKGKIHEVVNDVDELRSTITDLEEEVASEIQQLSDTIVLKVDASGNIVKVALSANPSTGSTFAVNADNISFTAGSVLRFTANNIVIDSTNFDLDAQGNVVCNNLTATNADISGKITSTDGKIGNWNIGQNSIYSRYTIGQASYSAYMISESAKAEIFTQMQNSSFVQRASLKQGFFELGNSSGATMDTLNPMVTINCGIGTNKAYGYINLYDSEYYGGDYSKPITTITNDGMSISANSTVKTLITKDGFKDTDFSANRVLISDGNQFIDTSSITTTELGYLSGVTSDIQTQLNGKQATITGGATTIVSNNLTASKALVSNANGKVAVSSVTATELGCLSGATNNIQKQIDGISSAVHPHIYGVKWDWANSNSPVLTRTDMSQYFDDPSPSVANGRGSSPFDLLYPWCEMQVVEDAEAGSLVKIPKFWYKMTNTNGIYTLQIADAPTEGFRVSPAHMDRGDGKGERDVIYVGRYHCDTTYKSQSGSTPIVNITRATARTNIHNLGSTIWQYDYLTMWTIRMLYLVEFASFDSQRKIGYGSSPSGALFNMGYTDTMQYHTGTDATSKTTYGGTQYRHIEGLWDNAQDLVDGVYYGWGDTYVTKNPSLFESSDSGGTYYLRGKVAEGSAIYGQCVIKGYSLSTNDGLENIPYATSSVSHNTNYNMYSCDYVSGRNYGHLLFTGGSHANNLGNGLFLENCWQSVDFTAGDVGCRLIKLP